MTRDASNEISRAVGINFSLFAQNWVIFAKKWKIDSDGSRYLIRRVSCHWSTLLPADKFESSLNSDKTRVEWTYARARRALIGRNWGVRLFFTHFQTLISRRSLRRHPKLTTLSGSSFYQTFRINSKKIFLNYSMCTSHGTLSLKIFEKSCSFDEFFH